jgi:hypothetical protein
LIHKKKFEYSRHRNYLESVNPITRGAAVGIAICSWFALSNHCAFAAVTSQVYKAATACPFHSKPAKQKEQPSQVQCCKVLRAVVFAKTTDWGRDNEKFSDADHSVQTHTLAIYLARAVMPLFVDTGPPGECSFAELILQSILPAHAPPFFV